MVNFFCYLSLESEGSLLARCPLLSECCISLQGFPLVYPKQTLQKDLYSFKVIYLRQLTNLSKPGWLNQTHNLPFLTCLKLSFKVFMLPPSVIQNQKSPLILSFPFSYNFHIITKLFHDLRQFLKMPCIHLSTPMFVVFVWILPVKITPPHQA